MEVSHDEVELFLRTCLGPFVAMVVDIPPVVHEMGQLLVDRWAESFVERVVHRCHKHAKGFLPVRMSEVHFSY